MKISKGKTFADFKLPENQEYYLFFSLHGDTQVELACSEKWRNLFILFDF